MINFPNDEPMMIDEYENIFDGEITFPISATVVASGGRLAGGG